MHINTKLQAMSETVETLSAQMEDIKPDITTHNMELVTILFAIENIKKTIEDLTRLTSR